jgi:hypothetical protein
LSVSGAGDRYHAGGRAARRPRCGRSSTCHLHAAGRPRRRDRELRPVKLRLVAVRSLIVLSESNQFVRPVPNLPPPLMWAAISAASRQRCLRGSNAVSWRCARRMWNATEVVREVGVHDIRVATKQQLFHLDHRLLGVSPGTVGVLLWWKIGFKDRFQHQHRCCHADPIPHGRDAQRPEFAVGLRYEHSSDGSGR